MAKASKAVEIKNLDIRKIKVALIGDSPLIVHKFSEKMKKQMLDKQMGISSPKEKKDPQAQYEEAFYLLDDGVPGFPVDAFKLSAIRGGKPLGVVMTDAKGAFFIHGEYSQKEQRELIRIEGTVSMREDMVKLQTGVADIRYRPQFFPWRVELVIEYNAGVITADQLINMFNSAGFGVGVGEWRPSSDKSGTFGRFHVEVKK